jgi:hypothetical protein
VCGGRDVGQAGDPFADVPGGGFAGEPDLDGPPGRRLEEERPVGVPLDADGAGALVFGPLLLAGVGARLVTAEGGMGERPFEAVPGRTPKRVTRRLK